jgi:cholesterol transport system auxiliary component
MIKKIFFLCLIFLMLGLSACSSLLSPVKVTPSTTYIINAVPAVATKQASRAVTLLVPPTETTQVYNTAQMAYSTQTYQVAFFAKNRWAEIPSKMLHPLIVQTLQKTHYFHAILSNSSNAHYDYILNTQLIEVLQNFSHQPSQEHLVLRAHLINASTNKVVASKQFTAIITATEDTPYGGVIAANRATATLLTQLAAFCLKSL